MAALTLQAVIGKRRSVTVTRSTDDAIGSAVAALVIDNTATWFDVDHALRALMRAVDRHRSTDSVPADVATSGASVE